MVWFQCEDCGDNLKKPKLPNHFRCCSASKLSCIDCGQVFGRDSVEGHTQCITEAEKYGPKGQGKASAGKPNNGKQKPDVDINVGLSERPPWFCSLCNTNATSKQTLLLHAEGKKHRAKARAFHASQQPAKQTEESTTPNGNVSSEKQEFPENKDVMKPKEQHTREGIAMVNKSSEAENGSERSSKKRKLEAPEKNGVREKTNGDAFGELGNGEVIQVENAEIKKSKSEAKKAKKGVVQEEKAKEGDGKKKIKWKKLITSAFKSNPEGALRMKKLKKLVLKSLGESGFTEEESELADMIEKKISSSSKFTVDGRHVKIVAKS